METVFYIILHLRTPWGLENYARFWLGNDRDFAYSLFEQLEGSGDVTEYDMLYLELMETKAGLPFNLKIMRCSLDEMGENCRIITKESFKRFSLKA